MQRVCQELREANPDALACIATVGTFDGVHLGHRFLLEEVVRRSRDAGVRSAVVTFANQPRSVLSPGAESRLVSPAAQKALLEAAGIDFVACLTFDDALCRMSALEFAGLLRRELAIEGLVMGHDSALGRGREGDFDHLSAIGRELGFWVSQMPALDAAGFRVSSTSIRAALVEGNVELAGRLLGRPFSLDLSGSYASDEDHIVLTVPANQALPCEGAYHGRIHAGGQTLGAEAIVSSGTVSVLTSGSLPVALAGAELTFLEPMETGISMLPFGQPYELVLA